MLSGLPHPIHISKSAIAALTLPLAPSAIWRVMVMGAAHRRARNAARICFLAMSHTPLFRPGAKIVEEGRTTSDTFALEAKSDLWRDASRQPGVPALFTHSLQHRSGRLCRIPSAMKPFSLSILCAGLFCWGAVQAETPHELAVRIINRQTGTGYNPRNRSPEELAAAAAFNSRMSLNHLMAKDKGVGERLRICYAIRLLDEAIGIVATFRSTTPDPKKEEMARQRLLLGKRLVELDEAEQKGRANAKPNATKPLPAKQSLDAIASLPPSATLDDVLKIMGKPGMDIGSAFHDFGFALDDDSGIRVRAHLDGKIISIEHTKRVVTSLWRKP